MNNADCIFCKIVARDLPSYTIWEDEKHMAFLSRWPSTKGFSVVITKEHNPSYAFENSDEVLAGITVAAKHVAKKIDAAFDDVGRTGMIFEGFGVEHLHAKLFPMHGTNNTEWKKRVSKPDKYFDNYEGYISSHDGEEASEKNLEETAEKIRNAIS